MFSHKLLRLVCPWALIALFVCSVFAALPLTMVPLELNLVWLMRALAIAQAFSYLLALLGARAGRAGVVYRTFVVLNWAALIGLWRFLTGRQKITW
jgi:hypothetical protein